MTDSYMEGFTLSKGTVALLEYVMPPGHSFWGHNVEPRTTDLKVLRERLEVGVRHGIRRKIGTWVKDTLWVDSSRVLVGPHGRWEHAFATQLMYDLGIHPQNENGVLANLAFDFMNQTRKTPMKGKFPQGSWVVTVKNNQMIMERTHDA